MLITSFLQNADSSRQPDLYKLLYSDLGLPFQAVNLFRMAHNLFFFTFFFWGGVRGGWQFVFLGLKRGEGGNRVTQRKVYGQPINPTTRPGSFYLKQHAIETFALSTLTVQTNKGHTSLCQSNCHQILHPTPSTAPHNYQPFWGCTRTFSCLSKVDLCLVIVLWAENS